MCVACKEFIKNSLTVKEFKSALWEVAREDEEHLVELEELLRTSGSDAEKLRKQLSERAQRR
jgi:hypothetical protein